MRVAVALGLALGLALGAVQAGAADVAGLAKAYGSREGAWNMRISPDGRQLLYFIAAGDDGTAVKVADIESGVSTIVLATDTAKVKPQNCGWKSAARVLCSVLIKERLPGSVLVTYQRMFSVATDGSGSFPLVASRSDRTIGADYAGARVIDWLPDDPEHVLMSVNLSAERFVGTNMNRSTGGGLSVQKVNILNKRMELVEPPSALAANFVSDGQGAVRGMVQMSSDYDGQLRDRYSIAVRAKGSRAWQELAKEKFSARNHLVFHGFDEAGEAALVTLPMNGRRALHRQPLDDGAPAQVLVADPAADVVGLVRVAGRQRPVAAKLSLGPDLPVYFDTGLEKRMQALSAALPGKPRLSVIDESWDGRFLLLLADSAGDAGRYYRFDTQSRELTALLPRRPALADVQGASDGKVQYLAADGTALIGHLTLPSGRETAAGLPGMILPAEGPVWRNDSDFKWLAQFFAQAGYAVMQPWPRLRDDQDVDASALDYRRWQTRVSDTNAAAAWLRRQGISNADGLVIVGWGDGGWLALMASIEAPALYKAVVAVSPVADLALLRSSARGYTSSNLMANAVGEGDFVAAASPARRAEQIVAPVLLFDVDANVSRDAEQGKAMAAALAKAGKRHTLVTFDGVESALDSTAARTAILARSVAWFEEAAAR